MQRSGGYCCALAQASGAALSAAIVAVAPVPVLCCAARLLYCHHSAAPAHPPDCPPTHAPTYPLQLPFRACLMTWRICGEFNAASARSPSVKMRAGMSLALAAHCGCSAHSAARAQPLVPNSRKSPPSLCLHPAGRSSGSSMCGMRQRQRRRTGRQRAPKTRRWVCLCSAAACYATLLRTLCMEVWEGGQEAVNGGAMP